uniref:NACHT, LRR and PYD domains-containing protein 1-like isoform X2 n=1 Tax=Monopterus albus TaxID=43700 RepID=UPI0009B3224F|nr:NACHT, LRR and PYD domains-containing protein 1-like isoform X2 [Monopterus albus]
MRKPVCMDYMPAGPLLDITVGEIEEAHLPHWICVDQSSTISAMFAVLHVDTCGDCMEQVSEVTPSHVKLLQPTFSPIGVMIWKKLGFSVKADYDALIYKSSKKEFLTLDVYLLPPDPALKQEVEQRQNSWVSVIIPKPGPGSPLQVGHDFILRTDKAAAKIQPKSRQLSYDGRNVSEVFFRKADDDFTLELTSE